MDQNESWINELRLLINDSIDDVLSESLPLCNRKHEILFFYRIIERENYLFLEDIYHIFSVERESGDVIEADVSKIIPEDMKCEIMCSPVIIEVSREELDILTDEYEELYYWFVRLDFKEDLNEVEKSKLRRLKELFERIIPDSILREIYYSFGFEMFNYIEDCLT